MTDPDRVMIANRLLDWSSEGSLRGINLIKFGLGTWNRSERIQNEQSICQRVGEMRAIHRSLAEAATIAEEE